MILASQFANDQGLDRIVRRQYVLQDPRTKEAYQTTRAFTECFRPGRRIVMSALFSETISENQNCPGCRTLCAKTSYFPNEEILW